jgi:hypothetical protein
MRIKIKIFGLINILLILLINSLFINDVFVFYKDMFKSIEILGLKGFIQYGSNQLFLIFLAFVALVFLWILICDISFIIIYIKGLVNKYKYKEKHQVISLILFFVYFFILSFIFTLSYYFALIILLPLFKSYYFSLYQDKNKREKDLNKIINQEIKDKTS